MRFKSGSWCTSIYSSLIKWTTFHGQQEQILAHWACFSDHLQHERAFTDDIVKTPVANKKGFFSPQIFVKFKCIYRPPSAVINMMTFDTV